MDDKRVQAIRCTSCRRLRPHPIGDQPDTLWCACGGREFQLSGVLPDEEDLAVEMYEPQLKERGLWKHT